MQIHLSDVTDSEGKHIQLQPELELDKISFQMGDYPILEKTPVELEITNTGNNAVSYTHLSGNPGESSVRGFFCAKLLKILYLT